MPETGPRIILASASSARAALLRGAGLTFTVEPSRVDEETVKDSLKAEGATAPDVALALADLKAAKLSARYPDALVIGADQMLDCNGIWFDKPPDKDALFAQLMALRGKTHHLEAALCVHQNGRRIWHIVERAALTMRDFSDDFLKGYVAAADDEVLASVGGYRLEGVGAQLFSKIEGDYFTILGLPLLPLLDFFRHHGVVQK
ncbi:septum formation protein Maf [Hwanghaeella grinnelliae]|uniref:Nucleoside triphosphate pyrophosphatase n=1 Tax=Hwanghaeella grinnelliae TaxID=2500179 RepID=A0A3S2W941_9PROT|nr:Maf family protein [Hwanghaeella grinnelliae]RVU36236.1 septum formation protein Maf [Hwanghaeella grinnelliae]